MFSESNDIFKDKNPMIRDLCQEIHNQEGAKKFDIVFDLADLSRRASDNQLLCGYIRYLSAVCDMYAAICCGRNKEAVTAIRERVGVS